MAVEDQKLRSKRLHLYQVVPLSLSFPRGGATELISAALPNFGVEMPRLACLTNRITSPDLKYLVTFGRKD